MQNVGPQRTQHAPEPHIVSRVLARRLLHVVEHRAPGRDAFDEMRMPLQAHDVVLEVARRKIVEQVDHPVLHAAGAEVMHDMDDARHGLTACAR